MIDGVVELCREHSEVFKRGWLFVLEEKTNAHADEITVSWLIRILLQGTKAIFIVFRENYAHYASLAKKMGNPIDPFLKSGQLTYIECFNTQWCS